ncbi:MAG: TIGR03619 family F420-dependent LLM class oxidoreductase [Candidatus Hermodarchaeota archaeon]
MKFGYEIENYDKYLDPDTLIQTAQLLEDSNFHSIWTIDHIMQPKKTKSYRIISEAITTLGFLAGHTASIKLGVGTLVLPLRNAILAAKQLATLDYLTKGRLVISFGAGWNEEEFEFLNQDFHIRGKRFNESLEVVIALWSDKTSFSGKYYNFKDVSFKPLRKELADLPILIAGRSDYAIRRAIKYGDGWFPTIRSATTVKRRLSKYKKELEDRKFEVWIWYPIGPNEQIEKIVENCEKNKITGVVFDLTRSPKIEREQVLQELCDFVKNY